jgi:predicted amidophosphoribosyltransferase
VPTVAELSAPYENLMLAPRPGPDICVRCFNFTDGYELCYACAQNPSVIDAIAPISYSVGNEQLHHTLASYKRLAGEVAERLTVQLAAVLWRYLDVHERCIARAAGAPRFALVTTVPSGDGQRDEDHPLRRIAGELAGPTRERHVRLLRRSETAVGARAFDPDKYACMRRLRGEAVLLIDDTWTTGANAQSAAAALKGANAGPVACVVIGRHVTRAWRKNDERLKALAGSFAWNQCGRCALRPAMSSGSPQSVPA